MHSVTKILWHSFQGVLYPKSDTAAASQPALGTWASSVQTQPVHSQSQEHQRGHCGHIRERWISKDSWALVKLNTATPEFIQLNSPVRFSRPADGAQGRADMQLRASPARTPANSHRLCTALQHPAKDWREPGARANNAQRIRADPAELARLRHTTLPDTCCRVCSIYVTSVFPFSWTACLLPHPSSSRQRE